MAINVCIVCGDTLPDEFNPARHKRSVIHDRLQRHEEYHTVRLAAWEAGGGTLEEFFNTSSDYRIPQAWMIVW